MITAFLPPLPLFLLYLDYFLLNAHFTLDPPTLTHVLFIYVQTNLPFLIIMYQNAYAFASQNIFCVKF